MKRTMLCLCLLLLLCGCGGGAAAPAESGAESASASVNLAPEASLPAEAAPEASEAEEVAEPELLPLTAEEAAELEAGTILPGERLEGAEISSFFTAEEIPDDVFARMDGVSYGEGCTLPREELRYLRLLHIGFDGETHIGELVCNEAVAEDFLEIFADLYKEEYPIEKILLVDNYGGDDELSMEDNNTSCFNFRPVSGTDHLSMHAYGRAIDINPLYNPYITASGYEPSNAGDYVERSGDANPYQIDENDLCYQLFTQRGFTWGGSWNSVKDYQHFQRKAEEE